MKKLCRFLGFGLLTVNAQGRVDVVVEPTPWKPRRGKRGRWRSNVWTYPGYFLTLGLDALAEASPNILPSSRPRCFRPRCST